MIEDQEMVVSVSHKGYIKRTSVSEYREQKRGGKGVIGASSGEDDFIEHLFVCSTLADLLVFTTHGRLYWMKVYEIPESGRTSKGRALVNLLHMKEDEGITAILPVKNAQDEMYITMATKAGVIKKTALEEFTRSRRSGIVACTLDDKDLLVGACLTTGTNDIILATKTGMAIRFEESQVRPMGRSARGVVGIRFDGEDEVVGMTIISKADEERLTLLTVCENGYGKRTKVADYRPQNRGGKGLIDIQTVERNGPVVAASAVNENSGLMVITSSGQIIRTKASDISVIGRNTRGVTIINLSENEKVVAVAHLGESEEASS